MNTGADLPDGAIIQLFIAHEIMDTAQMEKLPTLSVPESSELSLALVSLLNATTTMSRRSDPDRLVAKRKRHYKELDRDLTLPTKGLTI